MTATRRKRHNNAAGAMGRKPVPEPKPAAPPAPPSPVGVIDAAGTSLDQVRCRVEEVLPDGSLVVRLLSTPRSEYRQGATVRIGFNEFRGE